MSSSVLAQRLSELREAGIVAADGGYALTDSGKELLEAFEPLYRFSKRWARST
jgi:DNA-binding HxlR family transcriptional regulator